MADLFNQQISATYSGLLKTSSSGVLSASLSQISDGRGNTSPLYLSTDSIQFYGAYSFPNADGSANQVLKTDGAGVLTWEDDANTGTVTSVALSVPTGLTVTGSPITTSGTITIGGTLGVANGGTGATTLTGILVGNGTSAISSVSDGTVGQVLSTNANGTYSFIDAATGDVSISGTPSTNEVAIWTNSNTIKGDASFTMSSSTFQINNSTASSQSNLIISNNDTAINSIPANIIFNSNTLTSYKTLAQIYATKTDADIANASGKLNFSTTDAGVPSVKFIINSNGLSEFFGNVNAYNTSSLKLYSLGQEGYSNTEFLEIKKSSTNAIFNVNKVGTGSVRGLEFQTGGSPKLTISSVGAATFSGTSVVGVTVANTNYAIGEAYNSFGNLNIYTTNAEAQNMGGSLTLGGTGAGGVYSYAAIYGKKESAGVGSALGYLAFATDNNSNLVERMRISSGGNVGIGVTPSAWGSGRTAIQIGNTNSYFIGSQNTVFGNNAYNDGSSWRYITSYHATLFTQSEGGEFQWYTAPSGTAGNIIPFVNVMSIKSGGNIIFTSGYNKGEAYQFSFQGSSGNAGAFAALRVATNGDNIINFFNASDVFQGSISVNSGSVSYGSVSDYRLKENVTPITDALSRLNKLKPIRFNFIADSSQIYDGFIAHEVQEIIPEATSGEKDAMRDEEFELTPRIEEVIDEDGNVITEAVDAVMETRSVPDYQGIDQSKIVPLLTAAIQEQQTIIEDLKLRIEKLEG